MPTGVADPGAASCRALKADSGDKFAAHLNSARCMCPNDSTNWIASAKIAHHDPYLMFVRTQRIWALAPGPFLG
jgi:hypothetical protein